MRSVGRPKVDQQEADPWLLCVGMIGRASHAADARSNGSDRIRLPVAAKIALATAGATAVVPRPLTPPGDALLGMTSTAICGTSPMRGRPMFPMGRARGIPATHSGAATVA